MDDLVKRGRAKAERHRQCGSRVTEGILCEMANRIEAQAAEIGHLRTALQFYADIADYKAPLTGGIGKLWADCGMTARAGLGIEAPGVTATCKETLQVQPAETPRLCVTCAHEEVPVWTGPCFRCSPYAWRSWTSKTTASK